MIRLAQDEVDVFIDGDNTVIEADGMANYILMHEADAATLIKSIEDLRRKLNE